MKLSTVMQKENLRRKISEIAVEFASKYSRATPEEVTEIYNNFNKQLMEILKLKI